MSRGRRISRLPLTILSDEVRNRYILEWNAKELIQPDFELPILNSQTLFSSQRRLHVEIGPGTGEFLCALAEQNPQKTYLGIEASRKPAYYLVDKAARKMLNNVFVIKANFKLLIPHLPNNSWQKVFLHFPDPVHKRKDEKHRIFDAEFLSAMQSVLMPNGEISVVSDNVPFFEEMLSFAKGAEGLHFPDPDRQWWPYQSEIKSRFQAFWESKGVQARQFILAKGG